MSGAAIFSRVVRVREALADGHQVLADQLLAELEADLRPCTRNVCPACGQGFRFPGLLEEHLRLVHPALWEETVAA